jgi:hypothetical protein
VNTSFYPVIYHFRKDFASNCALNTTAAGSGVALPFEREQPYDPYNYDENCNSIKGIRGGFAQSSVT